VFSLPVPLCMTFLEVSWMASQCVSVTWLTASMPNSTKASAINKCDEAGTSEAAQAVAEQSGWSRQRMQGSESGAKLR